MTTSQRDRPRVTIAIPTYRRPQQLRALLEELPARIAEVSDADVDVLVVDNDPAGSAGKSLIGLAWEARYVIEPRGGIAAARNRALDECAHSDVLAFIDDDEIPRQAWLSSLLAVWRCHRSSAVMGRVISVFDENADPWVLATGAFSRPSRPTGTRLFVAAAGNLLLDLQQIRHLGVRFDEALGFGGGEDTLFSRQLILRGGSIVWCDESETEDYVVASRVTREWVRQRAYSSANAWARIDMQLASGAGRRSLLHVSYLVTGTARISLGCVRHLYGRVRSNRVHDARGVRLIHRGRGMVAAAIGYQYQEYKRA